jgi:hypothetical protein
MSTISASPPARSAVELRASGASEARTIAVGVNAPGRRTFRSARHGREAGGSCRVARVEVGFGVALVVGVAVRVDEGDVSCCGMPSTDELEL